MLTVKASPKYKPERKYIIDLLLGEFLGLEYCLDFQERSDVFISDKDGKGLLLPDVLFQTPEDLWLTSASLPEKPLSTWANIHESLGCNLIAPQLPIIYGGVLSESSTASSLPIDIFGSAFFMLTRYEELIKPDRDEHDRFPANASLAYQEGFLHRPIVNEYTDVLWWSLKRLWPGLKRRRRDFRMHITYDVDNPFRYALLNLPQILRKSTYNLVSERSLASALLPLSVWFETQKGKLPDDPFNTFEWMMNESEKHGLKSTFHFFGSYADSDFDRRYCPEKSVIRKLLRRIFDRGHEIGFHGSYDTYLRESQTRSEFQQLKAVCSELGIAQNTWSSRQHYLRWRTPDTSIILDSVGFHFDSSLAYADSPGFRSGCCYEYPLFDVLNHQPLRIRERPPVVLDFILFASRHTSMDTPDLPEIAINLKQKTRLFAGDFTLVWHNDRLINHQQKQLYMSILEG